MPLTTYFYMYILSTNVILYNQKRNYQIQGCNIEGAVIYLMGQFILIFTDCPLWFFSAVSAPPRPSILSRLMHCTVCNTKVTDFAHKELRLYNLLSA